MLFPHARPPSRPDHGTMATNTLDETGLVGSLEHEAGRTTDAKRLDELAHSRYAQVRKSVAENPHTSPGTLDALAGDPRNDIRSSVAWNPSSDPDTLERLSRDAVPDVIDSAERSLYKRCQRHAPVPSAWQRTEERMREASKYDIRDSSEAARKAQYALNIEANAQAQHHTALMNRNANMLSMFAQNSSPANRWLLCHNPHLPSAVLDMLMEDPEPLVRLAATRRKYALRIAGIRAHAREHTVGAAERYAIADGWTQWQQDIKDPEGTLKMLQHALGITEPNIKQEKRMAR